MAQMADFASSGPVMAAVATASAPRWAYPWLLPKAVVGTLNRIHVLDDCDDDAESIEADDSSCGSETSPEAWARGETDISTATAATAALGKPKRMDASCFNSWTSTAATTVMGAALAPPSPLAATTAIADSIGKAGNAVVGAGSLEATLLRAVGASSSAITLWPELGEESFAMVSDGFCDMVQGNRQVLLGKDVRCIDVEAHNGGGSLILAMMRIQQEQTQLREGKDNGKHDSACFPVMLVQRRLTGEFFRVIFHYLPLRISPEEYGLKGAELRFSLGIWLEVEDDSGSLESEDISPTEHAAVDQIVRDFKESLQEQLWQEVAQASPATTATTTTATATTTTSTSTSTSPTKVVSSSMSPVLECSESAKAADHPKTTYLEELSIPRLSSSDKGGEGEQQRRVQL